MSAPEPADHIFWPCEVGHHWNCSRSFEAGLHDIARCICPCHKPETTP